MKETKIMKNDTNTLIGLIQKLLKVIAQSKERPESEHTFEIRMNELKLDTIAEIDQYIETHIREEGNTYIATSIKGEATIIIDQIVSHYEQFYDVQIKRKTSTISKSSVSDVIILIITLRRKGFKNEK